METLQYDLYDIVEMKKYHPCANRSKLFQVVRLGADLKIMCLGCGNVIIMPRDVFNHKIKRIVSHETEIKKIEKN